MTQENVQVVRRAIEAFNRRDLDAAVLCAHPDVEVDWSRSRGVEAGIYRGREGTRRFWGSRLDSAVDMWDPDGEWIPAMAGSVETKVYRGADTRRYFDDLFEIFSELRIDDLELRDCGDQVLALYTLTVRGHDSGVPMEQLGGAVYKVCDGKIVYGRSYLSRREALADLGLEE